MKVVYGHPTFPRPRVRVSDIGLQPGPCRVGWSPGFVVTDRWRGPSAGQVPQHEPRVVQRRTMCPMYKSDAIAEVEERGVPHHVVGAGSIPSDEPPSIERCDPGTRAVLQCFVWGPEGNRARVGLVHGCDIPVRGLWPTEGFLCTLCAPGYSGSEAVENGSCQAFDPPPSLMRRLRAPCPRAYLHGHAGTISSTPVADRRLLLESRLSCVLRSSTRVADSYPACSSAPPSSSRSLWAADALGPRPYTELASALAESAPFAHSMQREWPSDPEDSRVLGRSA